MINKNCNDFGIIGINYMYNNLFINIFNKNYKLSIYDNSIKKIKKFKKNKKEFVKNYFIFNNLKDFIFSIKKPRKILIFDLLKKDLDKLINEFINYLNKNDILIDLSNFSYNNSTKIEEWLYKFEIYFLDIKFFSKYRKILLNNSSLIICGNKNIFNIIKPVLKDIFFNKKNNVKINYLGNLLETNNFIKSMYSLILYSKLKLIYEIYLILKKNFFLSNKEISNIFLIWNKSKLKSILLKNISRKILNKKFNEFTFHKILEYHKNENDIKFLLKNYLLINNFFNITYKFLFFDYYDNNNFLIKKKYNIKKYINKIEKSLYICNIFLYIQIISETENIFKKIDLNLDLNNFLKIIKLESNIESKILDKIYILSNKNKNIFNYKLLIKYFNKKLLFYRNNLIEIVCISIKNNIFIPYLNSFIFFKNFRI